MRLWLPVLLACLPAAAGEHDPKKIFTARCAGCHSVPDPAIRSDAVWLAQVRETT